MKPQTNLWSAAVTYMETRTRSGFDLE
jgi:hypothetical protein